jgi:hypothetical protein
LETHPNPVATVDRIELTFADATAAFSQCLAGVVCFRRSRVMPSVWAILNAFATPKSVDPAPSALLVALDRSVSAARRK